ncbi:MAG: hypothetical protein Kow0062_10970 [Acidobacteriota bacterium]
MRDDAPLTPRLVRRLTKHGIARFREYLEALRSGSRDEPPLHLLADPRASEPRENDATVEPREFATRLEFARYLAGVFAEEDAALLGEDVGLWSWLSLFWFEQVCPRRPDGTRAPGRDYRHVLEPGFRYGHRHLLAGPFLVYRICNEDAPLLLSSPLHRENAFHHELASRQALLSNPSIIRAVHLLYRDERTGRPRRGAYGKGKPGTLRRFVDVIQQLDLNYDLYSMSAEAIVDLLPTEFDRWKP